MMSLKETAKEHKGNLLQMILFAFFSGLTIIGQSYLFVIIVNDVFLQGQTFTDVLPYLLILLVTLFLRTVFQYLNSRSGVRLAKKVKTTLRHTLLQKYTNTNMEAAMQGQSGEKVSVMMDTVDEVDSYYSEYIPQLIQSSIIPLMLLVVIFIEHYQTGIIILITAPFIPIFMMIIGFNTKDKAEEQLDKMAAFSGKFLDTLQGLVTLKIFGRSKEQKEVIEKSSLDFRDATMVVLKTAFANSLALEFISMLSIGLIALEVAIGLIVFENISFYTGFLMLILAPEFYNKLKDLGSAFHTGRGSMGAFKKLQSELDTPDSAIKWGEKDLAAHTPPEIKLSNVGFQYGDEGFALENINVTIEPKSQVAIVGKTGSGKSTLLHLLAGIVPTAKGEFLINNEPRAGYDEKAWFNELSYISQNPYLFSGTVRENIAIGGRGESSLADIEQAAKKAGIHELVDSFENKYDTLVGEAGRGLSGGEKQRVALARAFLKQPSVILFDEPTMGLDLHTEQILQTSMKELGQSSTVITVAHRLHTIKNADKILFLKNGHLIAAGTHEELLAQIPAYEAMFTLQQGGGI